MSKIEAIIGGKQKGLADQVTIDPAFGCRYDCVGCYARKSSQRGINYESVINKDLDKTFLKKSIRKAKAKGFQLARVGKHCDPGDHINNLNGIIECCNDESFRCVVVSKSIDFRSDVVEKLKAGNHVLHISLGPYSPVAKNEWARLETEKQYHEAGVRTAVRLTRDITTWISELDQYVVSFFKNRYIVTPMRYPSKKIMDFYKGNPKSFEYVSGYYRPKIIHPSWMPYMKNVCGEINGKDMCCNCLTKLD